MSSATKTRSETADFLLFLVKLSLFMLVLRSFIVAPFNIPSESMQPRLLVGDYLLVAKWPYGYSRFSLPFGVPLIPGRILPEQPERGDVVVFKAPPKDELDYIKRVIGFPGETIQVTNGVVSINGVPVQRKQIDDFLYPVSPNSPCYASEYETTKDGIAMCRYRQFEETLPGGKTYRTLDIMENSVGDTTRPYVVPDGHLFVMGDNRDRSADSRCAAEGSLDPACPGEPDVAVGMLPAENLVGRALVSVFSTDGSAEWIKPWTWVSAARWDRIGEGF